MNTGRRVLPGRVVARDFERCDVFIAARRLPLLAGALETLVRQLLEAPCAVTLGRRAGGIALDPASFASTRAALYRTCCALAGGIAPEGWRRRGGLRVRRC